MPLTFPTNPADGDTHEYLGQTYRYAVSDDAWRRVHSEYQVISHNHDERYYTETEVDTFLAGKSDTSHTHSYLSTSGGTLTGPLTLPGSPTAAQQAATKNYVDTEITSAISGISGGSGGGSLLTPGTLTSSTVATTGGASLSYTATQDGTYRLVIFASIGAASPAGVNNSTFSVSLPSARFWLTSGGSILTGSSHSITAAGDISGTRNVTGAWYVYLNTGESVSLSISNTGYQFSRSCSVVMYTIA